LIIEEARYGDDDAGDELEKIELVEDPKLAFFVIFHGRAYAGLFDMAEDAEEGMGGRFDPLCELLRSLLKCLYRCHGPPIDGSDPVLKIERFLPKQFHGYCNEMR
jgi:hypothetical protein